MVSLCVYREGDWLQLEGLRERYDSFSQHISDASCF